MSSTEMSLQRSCVGMDHDISNSHKGGTSASSSDEEPLCTHVVDYSTVERLHALRGWSGQQGGGAAEVPQGWPWFKRGEGPGLMYKGGAQKGIDGSGKC